ncbi:MAG: hypothetical protein ACE5JM_13430 [Armatimonadota bacterium]
MTEAYWEGVIWTYFQTITNDGTNSGNHNWVIEGAAGEEFEVLYGHLFNGDASARTVSAQIRDISNNILSYLLPNGASVAAGAARAFPTSMSSADDDAVGHGRLIVAGTMDLNFTINSVAVSQDTRLGLVLRLRAGLPTVTVTSPTGATESTPVQGTV